MKTYNQIKEDPNATIEEICKAKFQHLSDQQLINKINRAPDFGWDDEGCELCRRIKKSNGRLRVERNSRDKLVIA